MLFLLCMWASSADDIAKSFEQITKDYGYPFEQHYVTTSDGYLLKMFRIQHGRGQQDGQSKGKDIFRNFNTATLDCMLDDMHLKRNYLWVKNSIISHYNWNFYAFYRSNLIPLFHFLIIKPSKIKQN